MTSNTSTTDGAYLKPSNSTAVEKSTILQNINDFYDKIAEFVPHYIWLLTTLLLFTLLLLSCCIHIFCCVSKIRKKKKSNEEPFVSYTPGMARILSVPKVNSLNDSMARPKQRDLEELPKVSYAVPSFRHHAKPVPTIIVPKLNKTKALEPAVEVTECEYDDVGNYNGGTLPESVPLAATFYGMNSNVEHEDYEEPEYDDVAADSSAYPSNPYNYQTSNQAEPAEADEYEDVENYSRNKVPAPVIPQSSPYQTKICTPAVINIDEEEAEYADVENFVGNASINYAPEIPFEPALPNRTLNSNKSHTKLTVEHPQEEEEEAEYHDISEFAQSAMKPEIPFTPTLPSRTKTYNCVPQEEEEAEYDDVANFPVRPTSYAPALPARKTTNNVPNNIKPTNFIKPGTTTVTLTLPSNRKMLTPVIVSQTEEAEYDDVCGTNPELPPSLSRKNLACIDGQLDDDAEYMDIDEASVKNLVPHRHEKQQQMLPTAQLNTKNFPVLKNRSQLFNIYKM